MAINPPPNPGFFPNAQNFNIINGQFTEVTQFKHHLLFNDHDFQIHNPIFAGTPDKAGVPHLPLKHSSALFTGRDEYLKRLRDYFISNTGEKRKSFLLHGMGGIGKTQICLKFIEENADL
jgi:hypothetical protein